MRFIVARMACAVALAARCICAGADSAATTEKRQTYLHQLRQAMPRSAPWEQWLKTSGELPPDFDALPSIPDLPDPLRFQQGGNVSTAADWSRRRRELLDLFQHYIYGRIPPAPGNVEVDSLKSRDEGGVTVREVVLKFGPEQRARLHLELLVPKGTGPFPVFVTQDNHRRWAAIAVSRGYLACVYAGADSNDDTGAFVPLWPEHDWSKLARRAWAGSRCVDYLHTLPEVDRAKIAITGHSRNGKLSLIAAAFDERFTAVISSSSGTGGACPFRSVAAPFFSEDVELMSRVFPDWLHPRARFFFGREHKLPIDQHELMACIAPRPCLVSVGLNDNCESVWAAERGVRGAAPVYALFQAGNALQMRHRPMGHETTGEDIEAYLDWLDTQWGRGDFAVATPPVYATYEDWRRLSGERIDPGTFPSHGPEALIQALADPARWPARKADILKWAAWGLGDAPPVVPGDFGTYGAERAYGAALLAREKLPNGLDKLAGTFGQNVRGDCYFPTNTPDGGRRLPAVVWLHPISTSRGYVSSYRRGEEMVHLLARRGFVVLAFDQIGHGNRIAEARRFYERHPNWSLLGRTVVDTRAAVDALQSLPFVDRERVFVLGYGTGGLAALHAAALDARITGVVSVAGFTPMRVDTADKGTGGVARWASWLPLQPRLGPFVGHEAHVPYDHDELMAAIAPRPVTVIAPEWDAHATLEDVRGAVEAARKAFALSGAESRLQLEVWPGFNCLSSELKERACARLKEMVVSNR